MWLLDNWNEESIDKNLSQRLLHDNIQLNEIACSVNVNNLVDHPALLRTRLNNTARTNQIIRLEEKFIQLSQLFTNAPSEAACASALQELESGIESLEKEQHNIDTIQDPPSMQGCRIYGRGGPRLRTGAEIADKELRDLQREAERDARRHGSQSGYQEGAQLNGHQLAPVTSRRPVFITFNASGEIL